MLARLMAVLMLAALPASAGGPVPEPICEVLLDAPDAPVSICRLPFLLPPVGIPSVGGESDLADAQVFVQCTSTAAHGELKECAGSAASAKTLDEAGWWYCQGRTDPCTTSGTMHVSLDKERAPLHGWDGDLNFYAQWYGGTGFGCPDPNGCDTGDWGDARYVYASLSQAVFNWNPQAYWPAGWGSDCEEPYPVGQPNHWECQPKGFFGGYGAQK